MRYPCLLLVAGMGFLLAARGADESCQPRLSIAPARQPEATLASHAMPSAGFALGFLHSVSGTPVTDHYRLSNGRLVQTAQRFVTHGAGLPSGPDEVADATGWKQGEGYFELQLRRPIGELIIRVDPDYDNRLLLGSRSISLTRWGRRSLRLQVTDCPDNETDHP